jgi:hypothetical protein
MKWMGWLSLTLVFFDMNSVQAQILVGSGRGGFVSSSGFSLNYRSRNFGFSPIGGYRSFNTFGYGPIWGGCYGPIGCSPFFPSYSPFGFAPPVSQIIVVQPPPIVFQPPRLIPREEELGPELNPDDWIIIKPRRQGEPKREPKLQLPPMKPVDLGVKPAELPLEPRRAMDAKVEANRQLQLGQDALANAEFGRAFERFDQAVKVAPLQSAAYFYRAQALIGLGKYSEAIQSITEGLKLRPNWPSARFQIRELYGNNIPLFEIHLQNLKNALDANPNHVGLRFLYAYELWFDDRQAEARNIFEQILDRSVDPEPIELFLLGGNVVRSK